ncbi:MAG: copper-binding protein [Burkholderiales bacterium RIFCSPLOWO2_02_FULL_57_36]|nr:MAG: copper-binding protein [Burkholderiales bacterium RIFCSPLOWO2_02_FULL_57_36]
MVELHVEGMNCNHCVSKITKAIRDIDATAKVDVDLKIRKVRVESTADLADIRFAVVDAGYLVADSSAA